VAFTLAIALWGGPADLAGAEGAYWAALAARPDSVVALTNLGLLLLKREDFPGAEKAFREAIRLQPGSAKAYYNLGNVLRAQNKPVEAVQAYRRATQLRPDFPEAYTNLGVALAEQKELVEAVKAYRRAIALRPDFAKAYYNLGNALRAQKQLVEAVQAYDKAIHLRPDDAEAHCNLGLALRDHGQFGEALCSLWRGHKLGSRRPGWPYRSAAWVAHCARLAELDGKLPAVRSGKNKPASPAEALELASLCRHPARRLHATAARLAAAAFAGEPKLAGDLGRQHRYHAACSAALAAAGRAEDAKGLGDTGRAGLRRQALTWLRADLAAWRAGPSGARARAALGQWLRSPQLAGLREQAELARLPAEEREACRELWADVAKQLEEVKTCGRGR
jgi:tetratricopeptide (TPR) repeat protein